MPMELYNAVPPLLVKFLMTITFAFVVGLEFRRYHQLNQYKFHIGSTRTFVLIGMLGFLLYSIDSSRLLFTAGFLLLGALILVYYWKLASERIFSLFSAALALLIYLIGPVSIVLPTWFLILFVVLLILILSEKPLIHRFSDTLATNEIATLAQFLIISGVILPLLPDQPIAAMLPVTYYKVWLAVIVVSGFSYLSYLLHSYFFKNRSLLITAILGGLYSSTVASVVIARRAHDSTLFVRDISSSLIAATVMMYVRLLVIIFLLDWQAGEKLWPPFALIILLSFLAIVGLLIFPRRSSVLHTAIVVKHPLELSTAVLFAVFFMAFTFVTQYVTSHFGTSGLNYLALAVGFTDIDPFILALLSGKFTVSDSAIVAAVILASGSNNLLKAVYAAALARNRSVLPGVLWLTALFATSLVYAYQNALP
ncbi:MAG: MgtC/SapB family protein [Gammaproteobacteria bacterium]